MRPDVLEIHYGWAFRAVIPRSSIIATVPEDGPVRRYGANRRGHLWSVVPDAVGLVRLTISPPARGPLAAMRHTVGAPACSVRMTQTRATPCSS